MIDLIPRAQVDIPRSQSLPAVVGCTWECSYLGSCTALAFRHGSRRAEKQSFRDKRRFPEVAPPPAGRFGDRGVGAPSPFVVVMLVRLLVLAPFPCNNANFCNPLTLHPTQRPNRAPLFFFSHPPPPGPRLMTGRILYFFLSLLLDPAWLGPRRHSRLPGGQRLSGGAPALKTTLRRSN